MEGAEANDEIDRPPRLVSLVLIALVMVGFLLVSAVVVVRGQLLDETFYADALVRADVYERVYTDVLADPELAEVAGHLTGDLRLDRLDPSEVRILTTNALHWTVPPATLRQGSEALLAAVVPYLRGEGDRLDPDIDVTEVLARVDDTAVMAARSILATAADGPVTSIEEYREAVRSYAGLLASGTVPEFIPVLRGTPTSHHVVDVILDELGPVGNARLREQVQAAVLSSDQRDALITATTGVVAVHAAEARASLQDASEERRELDVITEIADRAHRSKATVVDQLDSVRDVARWFTPATAFVGVALLPAATVGLVLLHRRRPRRAALVVAVSWVTAGAALLAVWVFATALLGDPLAPATETGPGTWNLPGGLRALIADVEGALGDELARTARWLAFVPIAAGTALGTAVLVAPRLGARSAGRVVLVGAGAAAVVGGLAAVLPALSASETRRCNGDARLCDRRYDEVVYAATHNSMSSPDVVFIWPEHDGDIRDQLDHGVRALLIDTHTWGPLVSDDQLTAADPLLPPAVAAQVFDTLGSLREPREGTFLCHNSCALGAKPFGEALVSIREFLEENPNEVVTLIIQDSITPAETADAFLETGLEPYLVTHRPGTPWPTLGDLVDRNERLVVFAENVGGEPGWYHPAFDNMLDTPYDFGDAGDFTCALNRGDRDATLFLLNHWVQRIAPDRTDASVVNGHDAIVERARQCEQERGQLPNYIAVNFYGIGDLLGAVATLNDLE